MSFNNYVGGPMNRVVKRLAFGALVSILTLLARPALGNPTGPLDPGTAHCTIRCSIRRSCCLLRVTSRPSAG